MYQPQTNFIDDNGVDLGKKLVTKDYLIDIYPDLVFDELAIVPELWVWGESLNGKLGNGVVLSDIISTPVTTFSGGTNWKQVSAGIQYTAAIKTDGTLWVWGRNNNIQLGINSTVTNRSTPVTTFAGGTNWKSVSCGIDNTAAVKTDGTLWVWGSGSNGQLGNNSNTTRSTPVTTFAGGTNWKQVSAGSHTAAIKTDGTLWVWGLGTFGRLGNGNTTDRLTPVTTFSGGTNWKQVSCGDSHIAAIKTDGTLWVWGYAYHGRLGNADTTDRSTPVTTFSGGTNWKQVSSGGYHTSAIKTDGTLWTWGYGFNGQLGHNSAVNRSTPVTTFAGGMNWSKINAGANHTAAIKSDGTLWVWGLASGGQLGDTSVIDKITPVTTFYGGTNWKSVDCGFLHTLAIKSFTEVI